MHYESNLISFYTLPNITDVPNIVSNIDGNLIGIVGESLSAQNNNGVWEGSLTSFDTYSGYWLRMTSESDTLTVAGPPPDPDKIYELHAGLNLISYPTAGSISIPDGIDDSIENEIPFVIGESKAAAQIDGQWVGSLTEFEGGRGYWINSSIDLDFQYNLNNLSLSRTKIDNITNNLFPFNQSQAQSFYFMTLDNISNIAIGDWIIAYNDNIIVGARQWNGSIVDVPIMGYDGFESTIGYCIQGDIPKFKIYSYSSDSFIDVSSSKISSFELNSMIYVDDLKYNISDNTMPNAYNIVSTYPNPFNPQTTIEFSIPDDSEISLDIYALNGEKIVSLINGFYQPGYYSVNWDASKYSSGIYFATMTTQGFTYKQKLLLVK